MALLPRVAENNGGGMKQTDPPPTETAVVPEFPPPQVIAGLLMSATLAPSMHNTQPWRFRALRPRHPPGPTPVPDFTPDPPQPPGYDRVQTAPPPAPVSPRDGQ